MAVKWYPLLFLMIVIILGIPLNAQEDTTQSDTYIMHYEDENPNQLGFVLLWDNICPEAVIRLNPGIDLGNVTYGMPIRVPKNEPCYQYKEDGWYFKDGSPKRLKYYENGQWLDEPYYSDEIVYTDFRSLTGIATRYKICVDELLKENILLHDIDAYSKITRDSNVGGFISLDVFIPRDATPCHPPEPETSQNTVTFKTTYAEISPLMFSRKLSICVEEITSLRGYSAFYRTELLNQKITVEIPTDSQPCYNEQGQRLAYYDATGNRLNEPQYSSSQVYIAPPGETMENVARLFDVCMVDLLRVNGFPDMPLRTEIELFIPPGRRCPTDIYGQSVTGSGLKTLSIDLNVCAEKILTLNPQFSLGQWIGAGWQLSGQIFYSDGVNHLILLPSNTPSCYNLHEPQQGTSIYDLERQINVCFEAFIWREGYTNWQGNMPSSRNTIYTRRDAQPCYDYYKQQRLRYPQGYDAFLPSQDVPEYSNMAVYHFQQTDTVYSISRQYNVCVHDLLRINPKLKEARPMNFPTFIPQTPSCYDEVTGMPLIYSDENGNLLETPRVGSELIYYGSQPRERLSYFYNVCQNRIEDANREKLDKEASYLGWIIPTDRPPCYDFITGETIEYVCYDQPMDFSRDYSDSAEIISFNIDGTHCYDLAKPETTVWYQNEPYKIISYPSQGTLLYSRTFTAWCFGVSLEEINTINDNEDMLAMLPYYSRAIPLPTRDCYVQNPQVLNGKITYRVGWGDALVNIAKQYDMPYQFIAHANHLEGSLIWTGQTLIIPDMPTYRNMREIIASVFSGILLGVPLYWNKLYAGYKKLSRFIRYRVRRSLKRF